VKTGEAGLEIIKMFEGFRSEPYLCPANVATIGFGSTRGIDGHRITLEHSAIKSLDHSLNSLIIFHLLFDTP
jgi:lysozyme